MFCCRRFRLQQLKGRVGGERGQGGGEGDPGREKMKIRGRE